MISFKVDDIKNMNAELRRFIHYLELCNVDEDAVFDSRLVSCELITNVLRHRGGEASFSADISGSEIVITVCSSSPCGRFTVPPLPEALAESGRGLYIVNAVSGGNVKISEGDVTVIIKINRL